MYSIEMAESFILFWQKHPGISYFQFLYTTVFMLIQMPVHTVLHCLTLVIAFVSPAILLELGRKLNRAATKRKNVNKQPNTLFYRKR
jgi:hypothetical protein